MPEVRGLNPVIGKTFNELFKKTKIKKKRAGMGHFKKDVKALRSWFCFRKMFKQARR